MLNNEGPTGTMYYLTGSKVFDTMKDLSESLAGRVAILDLYGFSRREINSLKEETFIPEIELLRKKEINIHETTDKIYENILNRSYPEVINGDGLDREMFYESYTRTFIEKDVRQLINIKDEYKFIKFLTSIAARTAFELNASDIANNIEIHSKTVERWLSILKNAHIIYLLNAYSNNNVQKAIKRPKLYFMDTGLACYLTGYTTKDVLEKSIYNGAIFENYRIAEIIKSFSNHGLDPQKRLFYYRDTTGKEIDLLIFYNNTVYTVEIKNLQIQVFQLSKTLK